MNKKIATIILAAGKGSRMKSKDVNKVALHLANKPMILHTVEFLQKIKIAQIIIVVGYAKQSVMNLFNKGVVFAEQKKRLGTAHAVSVALKKIQNDIDNILVLNGDDSAFYTEKIIEKLIKKHEETGSSFTFLTINIDNPTGLGRVVRNSKGKVEAVIEEKDATIKQRKINEINPACYLFKVDFLKKYLDKVKKSNVTGEYYLTSLIGIGIENNEKIETLPVGNLTWRGVNTHDELRQAQFLITSK